MRPRLAIPLVVAGVVGSLTSLLSTVLVARLLDTRQYGSLVDLLGVFFVISMPGSALLVGALRRITSLDSAGLAGKVGPWVHRIHRAGFVLVAVAFSVLWASQHLIANALSLPGSSGVVAVLLAGTVWVLLSIDRGILQSRRAYGQIAVNLVVEGVAKTVVMVFMAAEGFGIGGVALGVLAGELLAAIHARWQVRRLLLDPVSNQESDSATAFTHGRNALLADTTTALIAFGLLAILQNADVIVLGSRAPSNSGAYAAISVSAKALVFWALVLANYLLPEATIRWHAGEHALQQLGFTLAVVLLPAVILCAAALLLPSEFLDVFFGHRLASGAPAFAQLVGAMALMCITVLLTYHLLGVAWRPVVIVLALGALALIWRTASARGSLVGTADADLEVQAMLVFVMMGGFAIAHRPSRLGR